MMSEYLRVATVQVVQAVDLAELDKTIKWLVSKVQELPTADQANQRTVADSLLQDQIDALRRENSTLKDAVAQLQSKQDDMATRLDTKQDRDQADDAEGTPTLSDVGRRLVALEQRMEPPAEGPEGDSAESAGPDLNSQFQELLAGHRALAATVSGLQHELESKPNRGELDLKANRSELDALLRAGVSLPTVGDSAPPPLSVASDGTLDNEALVEALNTAMGDMATMRGQLAVMKDRLQSKAEVGSLEDVASQLAALKARQTPSARSERSTTEEVPRNATMADVEPLATSLGDLAKRMEDLELRAAAAVRPVSAPEAESRNHAVDAASSVMDIQPLLKDIYAQMENKVDIPMLDDLLRRVGDLKAAVEAKADVTTLHSATERLERQISGVRSKVRTPSAGKEPQWTISHELSPEYLSNQIEDLRSQVASLTKRMSQASFARPSTVEVEGAELANVQAALAALQGQLGELITRLAGKADAGEVARLELALNSKADLDELTEMRLALGAKADAAVLSDLQMAVAGKADQAALEEVKVAAALAADMAAGSNADSNGGASTGGYGNLLGAIQGMVADKVSKAELLVLQNLVAGKASADDVALLRAAIDDKASAAELSALLAQFSGRAANSEEIGSLDQRMGDVFAELAKIRADMAALPSGDALVGSPPLSGRDGDQAGLQRMLSALSREVGTLREGLDTVAHAANVLAVGLDGGVHLSANGAPTGGLDGRYEAEGGTAKENRSPRGGYERLVKLLGSGDYRHKMDAFDPTALQQMAQKLAYLEATFKSPAMGRVTGIDYGIKELERQVKRLGTDVRLMKDKLIDPGMLSPGRMNPGDHAMLASRPITGYRCMACDRPLDQLDTLAGPHVPTQQLPLRVPAASDTASRQIRSGRGDQLSPQGSGQKLVYNSDPTVRSVQNWYKDQQVVAAEVLPRDHVGPHLPPGGWRPSNPGSVTKLPVAQGSLPALSKQRASPTPFEYEQKAQQATGPPMEGAPANVTLPLIS